MESKIFEYPLIVREHHLDTFGHVNNAVYLEILEEARWEIITSNGFGLKDIARTGMGPVILEIQIRFFKELKLRQNIVIKTQSTPLQSKVGILKQWIENEDGEKCCEADFKVGLFDLKQRKLIAPTSEWKKALGVLEE